MRIAMIGAKGIPARSGGVERHVEALAKGLVSRGHEVLVYTRPWYTGSWSRQTVDGARAIPLPSIPLKHWDAISHTLLACIDVMFRRVDVIHVHGIGPSLMLPIVRLLSPARIVATLHSQDYHHQKWGMVARLFLRAGEWFCCRSAHETIVVSKELQQYAWTAYQKFATYIPNGTPMPPYRNPHNAVDILKRFGLDSRRYVLFVGRLVRHKGAHYLIDAYRRIDPTIPLVIVGSAAHTEDYVRYLRRLARGDQRILFLGEQTGAALDALYRNAALLVQPSDSEGVSIVLLEAMSYALPVVASDIPGNAEVLGERAVLHRRHNIVDLANAMAWLLKRPGEAHRLGVYNRRRVARYYQWPAIVEATERIYERGQETHAVESLREALPERVEDRLTV